MPAQTNINTQSSLQLLASEPGRQTILKAGTIANALVRVCETNLGAWVVKDFAPRPWLVRQTLGRFLVWRELGSLTRLRGMAGICSNAQRIGPFALGYPLVVGDTLSELQSRQQPVEPAYFLALEELVRELHARHFVHLDLRNGKNILRTSEGRPHVVDFQAGLWVGRLPRWVRRNLQAVDLSGVYKWWERLAPDTLDSERNQLLRSVNSQRRFWRFNYPAQKARLRE